MNAGLIFHHECNVFTIDPFFGNVAVTTQLNRTTFFASVFFFFLRHSFRQPHMCVHLAEAGYGGPHSTEWRSANRDGGRLSRNPGHLVPCPIPHGAVGGWIRVRVESGVTPVCGVSVLRAPFLFFAVLGRAAVLPGRSGQSTQRPAVIVVSSVSGSEVINNLRSLTPPRASPLECVFQGIDDRILLWTKSFFP